MVPRGRGGVINVSSVAGFGQSPGNVSYCATKAWMNSFTEGLDLELRGAGSPVRVQALCPGFTITEFHDAMGMSREGIPAWLWMRAGDVVDASLRGLQQRPACSWCPGAIYKLVVFLEKLAPRALRSAAVVRAARRATPLESSVTRSYPATPGGRGGARLGRAREQQQIIRRGADRLPAGRIPPLCDRRLGSGNRCPGGRAPAP